MSTDLFEQKESLALTVRDEDAIRPELVEFDPTQPMSLGPVETGAVQQQADPYYGAGALDITDKQRDILSRKFEPAELEILPTGEVYAPQVEYRRRLNEAFGIGRWSLRPLAEPKVSGKTVVRWYALYVNGKFASETFGEADFIENNPRLTWGTALESAKSNALMRCCKDIGVNLECWSKSFTAKWKAQYAVHVDGKWQKKSGTVADRSVTQEPSATHQNAQLQAHSQSATPPAAQVRSESADRSAPDTKVIKPVKFGKTWKRGATPYIFLVDDQNVLWTLSGAVTPPIAEQAIIQSTHLLVFYELSADKKFRNVSTVEIING